MSKQIATLNVYGDELKVTWTGSVWQAPVNGTQHASVKDAMREELESYLSACGEDVAEMSDEVEEMLENIETAQPMKMVGEWGYGDSTRGAGYWYAATENFDAASKAYEEMADDDLGPDCDAGIIAAGGVFVRD